MKVSKETSIKHHDELLRAASRLFRERGFDKVGIAEIATAADLTHGAFYTHFESKEALCVEVIANASRRSQAALDSGINWRNYVEAYLSPQHVRDRANGCPYAALAGDVSRESKAVKGAFSGSLDSSINAIATTLDRHGEPASRENAIQALSTIVGALVLARTAASPKFRDEILGAARKKMLEALD